MVIVTGGSGFIGSNLVKALNDEKIKDIAIVDHITNYRKEINLTGLIYTEYFDKQEFLEVIRKGKMRKIEAIIHMGARTDTTETDRDFLIENNTIYSQIIAKYCLENDCQFIYASSAATYGDGSKGYNDEERNLKPLNNYGYSKYLFDEWILNQTSRPKQWVGLKFFNVYGPNEYHKGYMASVVYHGFNEIKQYGRIKLFKSYKKEYEDGEQKRDFIYVKDAVKVIQFFLQNKNISGIFNVGTGKARTFLDLANSVFNALNKNPIIEFIQMPKDIRNKYQYFTQANMNKLWSVGYKYPFYELEEGVNDYVTNYLSHLR